MKLYNQQIQNNLRKKKHGSEIDISKIDGYYQNINDEIFGVMRMLRENIIKKMIKWAITEKIRIKRKNVH